MWFKRWGSFENGSWGGVEGNSKRDTTGEARHAAYEGAPRSRVCSFPRLHRCMLLLIGRERERYTNGIWRCVEFCCEVRMWRRDDDARPPSRKTHVTSELAHLDQALAVAAASPDHGRSLCPTEAAAQAAAFVGGVASQAFALLQKKKRGSRRRRR